MFNTRLSKLNKSFRVQFTNKGLMTGIIKRIDKNGVFYYTSNQEKYSSYTVAMNRQRLINN